jgi:4-hydroxybenzoate polyprenyltransferase/phosphoserine phosphatase
MSGDAAGSEGRDAGAALPLCVDLDGTLVATDTLWECFVAGLRARPSFLARLPGWLLRGRPALKQELARVALPDVASLPYREDVLAYLREARQAGRRVVLATATDRAIAERVAAHVGVFTQVIASDGEHNLKAENKRRALESAFGQRGFEYLGDSGADRAVWEGAGAASCVGLSAGQRARVAQLAPLARHFEGSPASPSTWLHALRVHQWVKNVLVFVPLVMAHRFTEVSLLVHAATAFLCLCLSASAVYLFNDLMDLTADRAHPTKRRRPFASGVLPIPAGLAAVPVLVVVALGLSLVRLPALFTATLLGYLVLNTLYTFVLKRVAIADVIFLASLYSLRVLAGGFATGITVSEWLIVFSLFFFLNLAFLKRYADLGVVSEGAEGASPGRDYVTGDAPLLLSLGPASGYLATLVLALYITSDKVLELYRSPILLWLLVPLIVFWISRMWLVAQRGGMHEDPVLFTTRDPTSYAVGALAGGVLLGASLATL